MPSRSSGFTIIELLIVISILGILITIGTVGWSSLSNWSRNSARATELSQWKSTFDLYKTRFAIYPSPSADGTYCVGNDFPNDKCGISGSISEDTALNTELARVSKLPANNHPLANSTYLGPYAIYTPTTIRLVGVFQGSGSSTCPKNTTYDATSPSGVAYCYYSFTR